jgi:peptide-methionine (S)-S-oxide reductase
MSEHRSVVAAVVVLALAGCRSSGEARADGAFAPAKAGEARAEARPVGTDPGQVGDGTALTPREGHELAAFAGGCFWGVENTFRKVPGVRATAVGYTGGRAERPTYEGVSSHTTGHAEAVLVEFDPTEVTYTELVRVFFASHDPTQKNRQGPDVGDQYRSAVFTFSEAQAAAVRAAISREGQRHDQPIVTEVGAIGPFWKAEEYHQQYDEKTGTESCPLPGHAL